LKRKVFVASTTTATTTAKTERERERMYIDYCTFFKLFVLILFSTSLCVLGAIPALRIDEKEITKVWVYYVFTYVRLGNSREGV